MSSDRKCRTYTYEIIFYETILTGNRWLASSRSNNNSYMFTAVMEATDTQGFYHLPYMPQLRYVRQVYYKSFEFNPLTIFTVLP